MNQFFQALSDSKNGAFICGVIGIVILYGIQRITEMNYQFSVSMKDGDTISLTPGGITNESTVENEDAINKDGGDA